MKLAQKLIYGLFALFGVVLLLFATGVFNKNHDNNTDSAVVEQENTSDTNDTNSGTNQNAEAASETTNPLDMDIAFDLEKKEITLLDAGDLSKKLFARYDFSGLDQQQKTEYDTVMTITQVLGAGTDIEQKTSQVLEGVYEYTSQLGASGTLQNTLKYGALDIKVDANEMIKGQLETAMKQLKEVFLDTSYTFSLTDTGMIESLEADYAGSDQQGSQFITQFTETIRESFFVLPEEAIGVGGSWKASQTVSANNIMMKNELVYTLQDISDGVATIGVVIDQSMDDKKVGTGSGTIELSNTSAFPLSVDLSIDSSFTLPVPGQEIIMKQSVQTVNTIRE